LDYFATYDARSLDLMKFVDEIMSAPRKMNFDAVIKRKHAELVKHVGAVLEDVPTV
jgi:hypothetical protein